MSENTSLQDGIDVTLSSGSWSCIVSQVTLPTAMSDTAECWNTPYACAAFQTLRALNIKCKCLTLFPLAWHISPLQQPTPPCSFPFSLATALLCLQQMPQEFVAFMIILKEAGINLRNAGQLLWQPYPPQTTISNILRSFLILCRLRGNNAEEESDWF